MAIITLSKNAFNGTGELARQISDLLGYRLVSRDDILEKTAQYGISKDRQDRARTRRLGMLHPMDLVLSQQSFERMSFLLKCHAEPASAAKYLGRGYPLPHQILRFAQNDTS